MTAGALRRKVQGLEERELHFELLESVLAYCQAHAKMLNTYMRVDDVSTRLAECAQLRAAMLAAARKSLANLAPATDTESDPTGIRENGHPYGNAEENHRAEGLEGGQQHQEALCFERQEDD